MDTKQFLELGMAATMKISALQSRKEELLRRIETMQARAENMPKYPVKDRPLYEALRMAHKTVCELNAEIEELQDQQKDVAQTIQAIEDPSLRDLLYKHYIQGEPWPLIADEMFFSTSHVFRLQKKALKLIKLPENYQDNEEDMYE